MAVAYLAAHVAITGPIRLVSACRSVVVDPVGLANLDSDDRDSAVLPAAQLSGLSWCTVVLSFAPR